jgi:hypothetical protein
MSSFEACPSTPIQSDPTEIEIICASQAGDSPQNPLFIDSDDEDSDDNFPPIDTLFERYIRQDRLRRAHNTTRDDRIRVQILYQANMRIAKIANMLNLTIRQVARAINTPVTPLKRGRPSNALTTPTRRRLQDWIQESPSNRLVPWSEIPLYLGWPCSIRAIRTAMAQLRYGRHIQRRVPFYTERITRRRLE